METAFGWLGQIFDALLQIVPRILIVRNTHQAVKWKVRGKVVAVDRGRRTIYWPLLTDVELFVVARQTCDIRTQVLMTKDQKQVVAGAMVVYWIDDIIKAIGERNWDVGQTIEDITMAVVAEEITSKALDELLDGISHGRNGDFYKELTLNCRGQLAQFGVKVLRVSFTDFSTCRVYKVLGSDYTQGVPDQEE